MRRKRLTGENSVLGVTNDGRSTRWAREGEGAAGGCVNGKEADQREGIEEGRKKRKRRKTGRNERKWDADETPE